MDEFFTSTYPPTQIKIMACFWLAIYLRHPLFMLNSTPVCVLHGGGAFGRLLGHEGGALVNGISALIKEAPEGSLSISTM